MWIGISVLLLLWLLAISLPLAYADGDCKGHSCNGSGGDINIGGDTVNVGGDTITSGNVSVPVDVRGGTQSVQGDKYKSKALGLGLAISNFGDVAISNCIVSTQSAWGPIRAKQDFKYDWMCVASWLDADGKYKEAAKLRCEKVKGLRDVFGDSCESIWTLGTPMVVSMEEDTSDEDFEEEHREELAMLRADFEAKLQNLQEEVEVAKRRPSPPPAQVTRQVVQQPYLSEKQKAALKELISNE